MEPAKDSSRRCAKPSSRREIERALPLDERLHLRLVRAWSTDRVEAERYLGRLIGNHARIVAQEVFLTRLPLPLAQIGRRLVRQAEACRAERKRKTRVTAAIAEAEEIARRAVAHASLLARLADLLFADRIRELARLDPAERDPLTDGIERQAVLDLRRRALTMSQVRIVLGCTVTELNRWAGDGRLPYLFSRQIRVHKTVTARFWESDRVHAATPKVAAWRDQDDIRRRFKRIGLVSIPRPRQATKSSLAKRNAQQAVAVGKTPSDDLPI